MFIGGNLGMIGGAAPFAPLAADFDGTSDWVSRAALVGIADSKFGTFSMWIRIDGGDGTNIGMFGINSSGNSIIYRSVTNTVSFYLTAATAGLYAFSSVGTYLASSSWLNVLASWDATGTGVEHLYINNVSDKTVTNAADNAAIVLTATTTVGNLATFAFPMNGGMAEVWFDSSYIDLSSSANRAKFIDQTTLKPVDLGATGQLPTGAAPFLYQSVRDGEAVTAFATNRGTGGNFVITGSLDLITPSPFS